MYFIRAMLPSQADGYRGLLACSAGALSFVTTDRLQKANQRRWLYAASLHSYRWSTERINHNGWL